MRAVLRNMMPLITLGAALVAGGCADTLHKRFETATAIGQTHQFDYHVITTGYFSLASWQKWTHTSTPTPTATVYVEGDGFAWISRSTPSGNPTPKTPVAFMLAAADPAANVVYLARPCQYTTAATPPYACTKNYWTGKRFAPEVLQSFQAALNLLAAQHPGIQFHLVGYSGGANIAGLLAATRSDVVSLRTVAGNVDNDFFVVFHNVSPMPFSLNMANPAYVAQLAMIPQTHFLAAADSFVPEDIYNSYLKKLPNSHCTRVVTVPHTTHLQGWRAAWPALLAQQPVCEGEHP